MKMFSTPRFLNTGNYPSIYYYESIESNHPIIKKALPLPNHEFHHAAMPKQKMTTPASAMITVKNAEYRANVVKYMPNGCGKNPAMVVSMEFCGGRPFSTKKRVDCSTSSIVAKYQNSSCAQPSSSLVHIAQVSIWRMKYVTHRPRIVCSKY